MSKNLHDLSDEEFDDLFRDSAEKSNIGFDPDAWNKMSQKLDAASAPPSSPGKGGNPLTKWGLPVIVVLLLLITGTYFLLRKPSRAVTETKGRIEENSVKQKDKAVEKDVATDKVGTENKENAKEANSINEKVEIDKVIAGDTPKDTKKSSEVLKSTVNTSNKSEKAASIKVKQIKGNNKADVAVKAQSIRQEETKVTSDKKVADNNRTSAYRANKKYSDKLASVSEANSAIAKNETETKSQSPIISEPKGKNTSIAAKNNRKPSALRDKKNPKTDDISPSNVVNNELKTPPQSKGLFTDSVNIVEKMQWTPVHALTPAKHLFNINLKLPKISFESPAIATIAVPKANTAFRRGLNIRLSLSPDLSFIPSNKIFKVGNNWAAILEYRFNNRFSIQTGVIRSMKYYGALPSQYEWNAYWTMPSPLKDIDATCKMLDVPLNIRWDISQKPNSRWFVGGGFTSYIMLKEEYRYNYENPYDPNIKRTSWEGKTGAYPFSVLNLSVGYERQLFRRLTFQAEPFYKAPLGKVGYGKVRLATAGVFFSIKYPF
jgi:hypothetical protein